MAEFLTRCCNAPYGVGGKGTTHWYLCTRCGKPTHVPGDDEVLDEAKSEVLLLASEHGLSHLD